MHMVQTQNVKKTVQTTQTIYRMHDKFPTKHSNCPSRHSSLNKRYGIDSLRSMNAMKINSVPEKGLKNEKQKCSGASHRLLTMSTTATIKQTANITDPLKL